MFGARGIYVGLCLLVSSPVAFAQGGRDFRLTDVSGSVVHEILDV